MSAALAVVVVHRDEAERARLRDAFEALADVRVAGERGDLAAGLALADQAGAHILVLELATPADEGLSAAAQYKMEHPDCAIFLATDAVDADTLLRALRAGAQEVVRRPLDRAALARAVERVAAQNARRGGVAPGRGVVTVFSSKGGAGVSTIATSLAVCIARSGRRTVALADLDHASGDAALMLGLSPTRSLADLLVPGRVDVARVRAALLEHPSGVAVLAQPDPLDRADGAGPGRAAGVLEALEALHDVVVVDAPHGLSDHTLEVFDRSQVILLVTDPGALAVRAARRSLEILHALQFLAEPGRVRLVVNRHDERGALSVAGIEATLGLRAFALIASDREAANEAIQRGRALCDGPHGSAAARDIAALARALDPDAAAAGEGTGDGAGRAPRLRLLGRA